MNPSRVISKGARAKSSLFTLPVLVGFFFSFRACTVLLVARVGLVDPQMGVVLNGMCECLLLGMAAFQAMGQAVQDRVRLRSNMTLRWVFVYLLFSGSSLAWSGTASLSSSLLYWCSTVSDVAIVVLLLRTEDANEVARSAMTGFIWSTCLLAAMVWCMPTQPDLRLGDRDYFNTNQLANLCAFAILFGQYLTTRNLGRWHWTNLLLFVTLVRSLSKTTLIAFFVGEGILLMRDQSMSRRAKLGIVSLVLVLGLAFGGLFMAYFDVYSNAGNQAETLTGRIGIWAYTYTAGLEKPWFGNGFDAMWKVFPPFGRDQFEPRHAENEILQQFFAYGVCGVVMLVCVYGSLLRQIRKLIEKPQRAVLLAVMSFVVVRGLAEAEPFDLLLPLWVIVVLVADIEWSRRKMAESTSVQMFGTKAVARMLPLLGSQGL